MSTTKHTLDSLESLVRKTDREELKHEKQSYYYYYYDNDYYWYYYYYYYYYYYCYYCYYCYYNNYYWQYIQQLYKTYNAETKIQSQSKFSPKSIGNQAKLIRKSFQNPLENVPMQMSPDHPKSDLNFSIFLEFSRSSMFTGS